MTSAYERELRDVLSGTKKGVEAVIRSCSVQEQEHMRQIQKRPFLVVRAAGSGMDGSGDLVALRGDCCFPIEVKTTKASKLYLSGRTKEQLNAMIREGNRSGLMPLYAYRKKGVRGDSWRIFRVETQYLTRTLGQLAKSIPPLPLSRQGSPFLDWDQGMPLNQFIAILCGHEDDSRITIQPLLERAQISREESYSPRDKTKSTLDVLMELERRRSVRKPIVNKRE